MEIKTIDIDTNEWFDRLNGNSYFSSVITLNFGMDDVKLIYLGFQYGYGSHYLTESVKALVKYGFIKPEFESRGITHYCRENGIILRHAKYENCLKRELVKFEEAESLNLQNFKK
ncbi:MAG TPA: hypothetical protein VIY47_01445 [Ignavibacteriaceae bacterium]